MKRRLLPKFARGENGQAIVMVALMSTFLMMILAIALETGFIWIQKRNLQTAADAAALAGAQELDGTSASEAQAIAAANDYAGKNVDALLSNTATVEDDYRVVRADVSKNASTVFADWFGFGGIEISAQAAARIVSPLLGGPGVVPLAIDEGSVPEPGELVTIKVDAQNQHANGNFGFIDLGNGANALCDYLVGGSPVGITDPQDSQTGNVSSVANCLPERMEAAQSYGCYSFDEVTQIVDGEYEVLDECNPLIGAPKGADPAYPNAQPTSVIVFPLITTWDGCSGNCDLDVVGDGQDPRTFVFFVLDPSTVEAIDGGPYCVHGGGGGGQCLIRGRFVLNHGFTISTEYNAPTGDFDPTLALFKIVQLFE
jgi:hypothetical protein